MIDRMKSEVAVVSIVEGDVNEALAYLGDNRPIALTLTNEEFQSLCKAVSRDAMLDDALWVHTMRIALDFVTRLETRRTMEITRRFVGHLDREAE